MDGSADRPYEPRFDLSKMNLHFDFSFSLAQSSLRLFFLACPAVVCGFLVLLSHSASDQMDNITLWSLYVST